jgi:tetratricopeptide (TPR) repeat protein
MNFRNNIESLLLSTFFALFCQSAWSQEITKTTKTENDGLCWVQTKIQTSEGVFFGVETSGGKTIIPIERHYKYIGYMGGGIFNISAESGRGACSLDGKELVPAIYDSACGHDHGWITIDKKNKGGLVDGYGRIIIAPDRYSSACPHADCSIKDGVLEMVEFISTKNGSKKGACTIDGEEYVPAKYDDFVSYYDDRFYSKVNGKYVDLSTHGVIKPVPVNDLLSKAESEKDLPLLYKIINSTKYSYPAYASRASRILSQCLENLGYGESSKNLIAKADELEAKASGKTNVVASANKAAPSPAPSPAPVQSPKPAAPSNPQINTFYYDLGVAELNAGNYKDAVRHLNLFCQTYPQHTNGRIKLAEAKKALSAWRSERIESALGHLENAAGSMATAAGNASSAYGGSYSGSSNSYRSTTSPSRTQSSSSSGGELCRACFGNGKCTPNAAHRNSDFTFCYGSGKCGRCGGTGVIKEPGSPTRACYLCNGSGKCAKCNGSGKCAACKGTGKKR